MLFNSLTFVVFLSIVWILYLSLNHRGQNLMLLCASLLFYGFWDWRFLGLLFFSVILDFFCGKGIARSRTPQAKKFYLVMSMCGNLGVLAFFKYFNFFTEGLFDLLSWMGWEVFYEPISIILPLGISFYTFQTMSYTIDLYRGDTQPVRSILDFTLYVTFFPQLVAGPIERASSLLPQLLQSRKVRWEDVREGSYLILTGYFKKMVIADNLAVVVEQVFDDPNSASLSGFTILLGVYCFAFQIYGDFSGYTDIARGVARLLGIDLMLNFRRPYLASNPSEFWHRWHISLSTWLRDYLYIPLGGSRTGKWKTYRNLIVTMGLGGLWHGAAGTFIVWGLLWGSLLALHRFMAARRRHPKSEWETSLRGLLGEAASIVLTFHLVCVGWVFFRAASVQSAWTMLTRIVGDFQLETLFYPQLSPLLYYVPLYFCFEILEEYYWRTRGDEGASPRWMRTVVGAYMACMIVAHGVINGSQFIYFQF